VRVECSLDDDKATKELGAQLAAQSFAGLTVLLRGPLGAGKTTLADGFLSALGAGHATSPTFVLAHRHTAGRMPVWHLDLYRLERPGLVEELDLDQYLQAQSITLVEWPERADVAWPADRVEVSLSIAGRMRGAAVEGFGRGCAVVAELAQQRGPVR
jgi:tRNA threonylcarbamoyl adenosine modification protein YjeE